MLIKGKAIELLLAGVHNAGTNAHAHIYVAGTNTLKTVYTDAALSSAASDPVSLDSNGRALVFTDGAVKVVVHDSGGGTVGTWDNLDYFNRFSGAWIDPRDYNDGSPSGASINAVESAFSGADRTIVLAPGTWLIDADLTIQSTKTLRVECGALLSVASGKTLTILGKLEAGLYTIFSGSGSVVLSGSKYIDAVYPQWWGAKGDGTTNDRDAVQKAFSSGLPVRSPKVTYAVTSQLVVGSNADIDMGFSTILRYSGVFDVISNSNQQTGDAHIKLSNLVIDGNKAGLQTNDRVGGLMLYCVTDSELRNITVINTRNEDNTKAGIWFYKCQRVDAYNIGGYDNDKHCIYLRGESGTNNNCQVRIIGSVTGTVIGGTVHGNGGSGIFSQYCDNSEFYDILSLGNTGSNVCINGLCCKGSNIRSYSSASGSGLEIGQNESGKHSDDSIFTNVHSYGNAHNGIEIRGSNRVQVIGAEVHENGQSGSSSYHNVHVHDGAAAVKFLGLVSRNSSGGSGVNFESGAGHVVDAAEVFGNQENGIRATTSGVSVKIGRGVRCYNNSKRTDNHYAGILLDWTTNCFVAAECFEDEGTGNRQGYGLWIDGGTNHVVNGANLYGHPSGQDLYVPNYGPTSSHRFYNCNPHTYDHEYIGDKKHYFSDSTPGWTPTYVGEVVWKTNPYSGGYAGWVYTGSQYGWKTFGAIS